MFRNLLVLKILLFDVFDRILIMIFVIYVGNKMKSLLNITFFSLFLPFSSTVYFVCFCSWYDRSRLWKNCRDSEEVLFLVSFTVQDTPAEMLEMLTDNRKMGPLNIHYSSLIEENRNND